ncbi:MAG: sensor histidine kinase, partial [Pseudomonadota bacterium]
NGAIEHLATVFNNLIQNATDHAKSKLLIVITRANGTIDIAFNDDGPGIPEHMRTELLKPFQRGTQNNSGYGLGLAVVERIAKHHNATLTITDSTRLGGANMTLRFWVK